MPKKKNTSFVLYTWFCPTADGGALQVIARNLDEAREYVESQYGVKYRDIMNTTPTPRVIDGPQIVSC